MMDVQKIRRESMRWQIINTLNHARPYITHEYFLYDILKVIWSDITPLEMRKELAYLSDRGLILLDKAQNGDWFTNLTRKGVDIAEYTIDCHPGINRPKR